MSVDKFEDLVAWQRSRELTREVYRLCATPKVRRDFGFCSQVQRASVSIMSNLAEGFERARPKEFHQALSISKGSCAEVRSLLYVALDCGYVTIAEYDRINTIAVSASQLIGALRAAVARRIKNEE